MSSRIRNAPGTRLNTIERTINPIPKLSLISPGPVYNVRKPMDARTTAFADADPRKGMLREKDNESKVFISR